MPDQHALLIREWKRLSSLVRLADPADATESYLSTAVMTRIIASPGHSPTSFFETGISLQY